MPKKETRAPHVGISALFLKSEKKSEVEKGHHSVRKFFFRVTYPCLIYCLFDSEHNYHIPSLSLYPEWRQRFYKINSLPYNPEC